MTASEQASSTTSNESPATELPPTTPSKRLTPPSPCRNSPNSLNALISSHSVTLQSAREALTTKKSVAFESEAVDYGYDVDYAPPPVKRRRFERRNSKTPQMLLAMQALPVDFFTDDVDDDEIDEGLGIAKELVKQLQNRRTRL